MIRYEKAIIAMAKQRVTLEVLSYHATAPAEEANKLKVQVLSARFELPNPCFFFKYTKKKKKNTPKKRFKVSDNCVFFALPPTEFFFLLLALCLKKTDDWHTQPSARIPSKASWSLNSESNFRSLLYREL